MVICGNHMLEFCTIDKLAHAINGQVNGHSLMSSGVRNLRQVYSHSTNKQWDKVRFDSKHNSVAVSSSADSSLMLLRQVEANWVLGPQLPDIGSNDRGITALAFQPLLDTAEDDPDSPRRLAVTFDSGEIYIYDVEPQSCTVASKFSMGPGEQALALAWSGDGKVLAVASDESIKIWTLEQAEPYLLVSWQAAPAKWYQGNDNNLPGDEDGQAEPSLSWNAEGKKLAFAVGRKVRLQLAFTANEFMLTDS